ncbi:hypothetical protein [Spiroplasma poulsonii]|nr:hypothetical protein [Spiroplasma poulsonii]UNF62293.1 hypothetical protein MNU24_02190 [Spiroplasma poulsonii]
MKLKSKRINYSRNLLAEYLFNRLTDYLLKIANICKKEDTNENMNFN